MCHFGPTVPMQELYRCQRSETSQCATLGPQSPRRSFTDANGVKLHNVSEVFHKIAQPQASTETPKAGAWRTCGLLLREQAEVGTPVVWTPHPPLPLLALPASPCGSSIRSS